MRRTMNVLAGAAAGFTLALSCQAVSAGEPGTGKGENLLVFVGQKIGLAEQKAPSCDNCIMLDSHYVAEYRILETVHGNYRGNTITFDVYDHYGAPAFSRFDTVLLYVSRRPDGSWVHEKYQFNDLYKGRDGEWYGCGDPYGSAPHPPRTVRAQAVEFATPVSYPLDGMSREKIERFYPAGYFEIRDGRAVCLLGTSVAGLFEAKKETVLAARGIFR